MALVCFMGCFSYFLDPNLRFVVLQNDVFLPVVEVEVGTLQGAQFQWL